MKALLYISIIFLCSCSAEKRLARLIKNNPELLVKDTITIYDTTIVKGSMVDSLFVFSSDTIVLSDSNQIIKYYYNTLTKNHYIKGEVREREIVKEINVPYDKIVPKDLTFFQEYGYWFMILLGMVIIILSLSRKTYVQKI
jgi:hypothetical protein